MRNVTSHHFFDPKNVMSFLALQSGKVYLGRPWQSQVQPGTSGYSQVQPGKARYSGEKTHHMLFFKFVKIKYDTEMSLLDHYLAILEH